MTKNVLKRDDSGLNHIGLGPIDVVDVAANVAISHLAIVPAEDVDIYFVGGNRYTYTLYANTPLVVTENMRLSTETRCLVY